ncbi:hypothetical protein BGZ94_009982 [Podila epigama]|nr:hypothetical protein BGZ94_009982 [Podila epigama]
MSRHSKNNTARGHFTYAEMHMLDYGTKKTARDPVCCPEGHLSCRECIYENILAQKLEIERQAKMLALQEAQAQKEQEHKEELAQQIILNEFEKSHMGVLSKSESVRGKLGKVVENTTSSPLHNDAQRSNDKKRPFELDPEELERRSNQERIEVAKAIEDAEQAKKPALPSFWLPSLTPSSKKTEFKATKVHTTCTASEKEHKLSLKSLITVKFETAVEDHDESEVGRAKSSAICPICRKGFTNSTKMSILKGCGHVYCDSCCKDFIKKDAKCQVCGFKAKGKDIVSMTTEGSGYSGGGAKEAKKFDVAFQ